MSDGVLYPEDRVPPHPQTVDPVAVRATAKNRIRAAVPRGGQPKTYDELIKLVRKDDGSGCHTLWPEEVVTLIDEVKAERPSESQKLIAETIAKPVEEDAMEAGGDK